MIWEGFERKGVNVVGTVPGTLPAPSFPNLTPEQWARLLPLSFLIAIVVMVQTAATTRSFPSDPDQGHFAFNLAGAACRADRRQRCRQEHYLGSISGLLPPFSGRLVFEGHDITQSSAREILARGIAHCTRRAAGFS